MITVKYNSRVVAYGNSVSNITDDIVELSSVNYTDGGYGLICELSGGPLIRLKLIDSSKVVEGMFEINDYFKNSMSIKFIGDVYVKQCQ